MSLKYVSAFFLILFLTACNRTSVKLVFTSAKGEIEPIQNLVFTFDKPLINDSLAGSWDSTEYIRFTPAVKGRFRWEKPDQLVFSPAMPFMPATEYKAELQSELLEHSPIKKIDNPAISFHTPELRIENIFGRWVAESAGSSRPVPEVDLFFNYEINVGNLKEKLRVLLNGQSVPFQFRTLSSGKKITVRLLNVQPVDKELSTTITVDKSIIAEGGKTAAKNDLTIEGNISSPYNLAINEITTDHDGTRANIYVRTNQQVIVDGLASKILFDPSVKFTVAASDDGFVISSDHINPDKSYMLDLKKGIRGSIGGLLREDHTDQVAFGELEPALSFGNSKAVYLSAKGNELIELKITNVPKIRIIVSKIFESNLMAANRYGYYPVDKSSDEE
jgi:alpha-2-macroglobulin